jgi:WD40 repeat protein
LCMTEAHVIIGSKNGLVRVYDLSAERTTSRTMIGHKREITCLCAANVNEECLVISGSLDGTVRLWSAASGQCVQQLIEHTACVKCVAVHGCL